MKNGHRILRKWKWWFIIFENDIYDDMYSNDILHTNLRYMPIMLCK